MNQCLSIKNKKSNIQCPYKQKPNSNFCGIHMRSNKIILYNSIMSSKKRVREDTNIFYTKNMLINNDELSLNSLIYTINILHANELIKISNNPIELKTKLYNYYILIDYYKKYITQIIKIQSLIRRFLILSKKKIINDNDFYTLEPISSIPSHYFFKYSENGFTYGCDIRSLFEYVKISKTNPYTRNNLSKDTLNSLNTRALLLMQNNKSISIKKDKLTSKQKFKNHVLEIFQKINMLDNYTDPEWFEILTLNELKTFFFKLEDMWNYRTELTQEQKNKIVKSDIFKYDFDLIKKTQNIKLLRKILLTIIDKLISEGINISEKKYGAMIVLSTLVEVSFPAYNALPQYVQSFE